MAINDEFKYDAFISYRHVEPDATIAEEIHKLIETFKVPKNLETDVELKHRVFRDREELSAKDLSGSIEEALENSFYLIVICSKRTPLSHWCEKEIETFRKLHGDDRIIPVLVEGEPDESFPAPLKNLKKTVTLEDGGQILRDAEHLAADLRNDYVKSDEFESYEVLEEENPAKFRECKKDAVKILRDSEIYRVVSGILDCNFGDLKQRDKERKMRAMVTTTFIVASVFLVFGISMLGLYIRATRAELRTREQNILMTLISTNYEIDRGNKTGAMLVVNDAVKEREDKMENLDEINSRYYSTLYQSLIIDSYEETSVIDAGDITPSFVALEDNIMATSAGLGEINIWNVVNGNLEGSIKTDQNILDITFNDINSNILASTTDNSVIEFDRTSGEAKTLIEHEDLGEVAGYDSIEFLSDGKILYGRATYALSEFWNAETGDLLLSQAESRDDKFLHVDNDGKEYFSSLTYTGLLETYNFTTGEKVYEIEFPNPEETNSYTGLGYLDNGDLLVEGKEELYRISRQGEITESYPVYSQSVAGSYFIEDGLIFKNVLVDDENTFVLTPEDDLEFQLDGIQLIGRDSVYVDILAQPESQDIFILWQDGILSIYRMEDKGDFDVINPINIELNNNANPYAMELSASSNYILASFSDGSVSVVDVDNTNNPSQLKGTIEGASRDGNIILIWNEVNIQDDADESLVYTGQIDFIEAATGELVSNLQLDSTTPPPICVTNKVGTALLAGYFADSTINYFDKETGATFLLDNKADTRGIVYSQDEKYIYASNIAGDVNVFDSASGDLVDTYHLSDNEIGRIKISEGDELISVRDSENKSIIFDLKNAEIVDTVDGDIYGFIKDGEGIAAIGIYEDKIFKWSQDKKLEDLAKLERRIGNQDVIYTPNNYLSNNGNFILATTHTGETLLLDSKSGIILDSFEQQYSSGSYLMTPSQWIVLSEGTNEIYVQEKYDTTDIQPLPSLDSLIKESEKILDGRQLEDEN